MSDENKKLIRFVRNNELQTSSDGVYTWVLFTDNDGEYQFVAKKVLTIQELSTKHNDIVADVFDEIFTIHFAGELLKKDGNMEINFLSGSLMAGPFEGMTPLEVLDIHNEAIEFLNQRFNLTFTNQREVKTLITTDNVVYTHDNIQLLLQSGAEIKRFKTRKLCTTYENRIKDEMTAIVRHEQNMRVWKKCGGEEPKFNYNPSFEFYDINFTNSSSIDLG